jgi:hypothetical protein
VLRLYFQKVQKALLQLRGAPPEKLGIHPPPEDDPLHIRRYPEFGRILSNYRPKPYGGHVILLRSHYLDGSYSKDRTVGWGRFAAKIEVVELPGDHLTILTEHIGVVAEYLGKCLSDYNAELEKSVCPVEAPRYGT